MSRTYTVLQSTDDEQPSTSTAITTNTAADDDDDPNSIPVALSSTNRTTNVRRRSSAIHHAVVQAAVVSSSIGLYYDDDVCEHSHEFDTIPLEQTDTTTTVNKTHGRTKRTHASGVIVENHNIHSDQVEDGEDDDINNRHWEHAAHNRHHVRLRLPKCLPPMVATQLHDYVHVLNTYPMYRYYLLSHICQHVGDWFVRIASLLLVQELALSKSGVALGHLVLASKLPMSIFAQVGGYISDRYDRRITMIVMDIFAGIAVLGYLVGIQYKSLPIVYVATMIRSSIGSAYYPVTTGIVPLLIPHNRHDLQYAVTMNSWAWSFMAIIGGVIAGGATALIGLQACYILDSVTFFLSATVVYFGIQGNYSVHNTSTTTRSLNVEGQEELPTTINTPINVAVGDDYIALSFVNKTWNCIKQLSVYLTTCGFGLLVLLKPTASLIWGPEDVIGSLFATVLDESTANQDVEAGKSSLRTGLLFTVVGVGTLAGTTLMNFCTDANQPRTLQRACVVGVAISTIGWLAISLAPDFEWFLVLTCFRVMGSSILYNFSTMLLQALVEKEYLGRVLSVEYTIYTLTEAFSATATGELEDKGLSTHMLALFAASLGALCLAFWSTYHVLGYGAAQAKFNQSHVKATHDPEPSISELGMSIELSSVMHNVEEGTTGEKR